MENVQITSAENLPKIARKAAEKFKLLPVWWRGEPKPYETALLPKLYRSEISESEISMSERFKQRAPTRHAKCPTSHSGWLFLMQHYGLHTRLLDWTESIMVASFFASEHPEEDGVLWGLSPFLLNKKELETDQVVVPSVPEMGTLISGAFEKAPAETEKIVALVSEEVDIRMMVQLSAFTVHGKKLALNTLANSEDFLMRFEIPGEAKAQLKKDLSLCGITRSYLFPDLENLANDITATYTKPKP